MTPEIQIAVAQIKNNYPTYLDLIDDSGILQINYSKFGGMKRYKLAKDIYWFKFNSRCTTGKIAEIWKLHEDEVKQLIKEFRDELYSPVKYYD